mgnify:CR=1 FL=1
MGQESNVIVCLSGPRGSGKTLISKLLRKKYGAVDLHVGYIMRMLAAKVGMTPIDLMNKLIRERGKEGVAEAIAPFVRSFSKKSNMVVIQGVYRPEDIIGLKRIFPDARFHTVFVDASNRVRVDRVANRDKIDREAAQRSTRQRDAQRKSHGIDQLKRVMDQRVKNNGDIPGLFRRVDRAMQRSVGHIPPRSRH